MKTQKQSPRETKPTCTSEEEEKLIEDMMFGDTRCYYCGMVIDQDSDGTSTEYGVFWACENCFPKWGNPDQHILDGRKSV
jgi:hypothetical protein